MDGGSAEGDVEIPLRAGAALWTGEDSQVAPG